MQVWSKSTKGRVVARRAAAVLPKMGYRSQLVVVARELQRARRVWAAYRW